MCNRDDVTTPPTPPGSHPVRILVVDDDARVRRALCALIRSAPGLSVAGEASSTRAAYEADELLSPEVVLLDVLLPSAEDGFEALRRLVAKGRTVVALSIRDGLRAAALRAGATAFVDKYADPDVLLQTVQEVSVRSAPRAASPSPGPSSRSPVR